MKKYKHKFISPLAEGGKPKYAIRQVPGEAFMWTIEDSRSVYRTDEPHFELDQFDDVTIIGRERIIPEDEPEEEEDTETEPEETPEDAEEETPTTPPTPDEPPEEEETPEPAPDPEEPKEEESKPKDPPEEKKKYTKAELGGMGRGKLDDIARDIGLDPATYSNMTKLRNAIIRNQGKK